MAKLVRAPLREVRSIVFDSARWSDYKPRGDDIIIATYSKCGTTWMQRIVSMLVFGDAAPRPIWDLSPWPDMRLFGPIETILANAEAQTHRRFFKSHLPYDALPVYEGVKFIHVARDGRDAAMSLHNHLLNFTPAAADMMAQTAIADPKFGHPPPPVPDDPGAFFHGWVAPGGDAQGDPYASFFHVEKTYWAARRDPNMLLVHYNDLKRDRAGEMKRIADFLDIEIPDRVWPQIVEAAGFDAMKQQGSELIPMAHMLWDGGPDRFLHKGTNGRWQDVCAKEDLVLYEERIRTEFSAALGRWIAGGRGATGDPETIAED